MTKPNPKPDDPEQSKQFIDAAKEAEADDERALERAFKKITASSLKKNQPQKKDSAS